MGRIATDLSGKRFSRLIVIERAGTSACGHPQWKCKCDCGNITIVDGRSLKSGATKSCGCAKLAKKEVISRKEICEDLASFTRLKAGNIEPYQHLANAIVAVAADDYRIALATKNTKALQKLDSFFESNWYEILTSLDSVILRCMLRSEMITRNIN